MSESCTWAYTACHASRVALVMTCMSRRAAQHVTTSSCTKNAWLDSVSCRVVMWRAKWNLGYILLLHSTPRPRPLLRPNSNLVRIIIGTAMIPMHCHASDMYQCCAVAGRLHTQCSEISYNQKTVRDGIAGILAQLVNGWLQLSLVHCRRDSDVKHCNNTMLMSVSALVQNY